MLNNEIAITSLALRLLTEAECKAVLADPNALIVEWESAGYTFVASVKELGILRTGALGGDMREVHGGWKYATQFGMWKECEEIKAVAPAFTRGQRGNTIRKR